MEYTLINKSGKSQAIRVSDHLWVRLSFNRKDEPCEERGKITRLKNNKIYVKVGGQHIVCENNTGIVVTKGTPYKSISLFKRSTPVYNIPEVMADLRPGHSVFKLSESSIFKLRVISRKHVCNNDIRLRLVDDEEFIVENAWNVKQSKNNKYFVDMDSLKEFLQNEIKSYYNLLDIADCFEDEIYD